MNKSHEVCALKSQLCTQLSKNIMIVYISIILIARPWFMSVISFYHSQNLAIVIVPPTILHTVLSILSHEVSVKLILISLVPQSCTLISGGAGTCYGHTCNQAHSSKNIYFLVMSSIWHILATKKDSYGGKGLSFCFGLQSWLTEGKRSIVNKQQHELGNGLWMYCIGRI